MQDPPPISTPANPEQANSPDLTGRVLKDYRILRRLGQGGMGQVYLAEQLSLKRKVALKVLRADLSSSPTALERFKREASTVAQLTHANIVQVYAIDEAEEFRFMALEYVEGRNLRDYLDRKGPPDILLALSIMRQVASALQRAGELGIIHRDIKPENILITRKGEVKVADFGLARLIEAQPALSLTQSGVTMGTPLYMSPEQVEGKPVDVRTDIYSFGVTCYHMLAGHPPYQGASPFEVAFQHVRGEKEALAQVRPDLPAALCAVVHKMMARAPSQRYQTGGELLKDLVRLRESLGGQTGFLNVISSGLDFLAVCESDSHNTHLRSSAPTAAALPTIPRSTWRGGKVLLFGLSLILAAAGGVGLAWFGRQSNQPTRLALTPPPEGSLYETLIEEPEIKERNLYIAVDLHLKEPQNIADMPRAYQDCLKLILEYLEQERLDDAEQLCHRLTQLARGKYRSLFTLGHLGMGIVYALRHQARASNQLFAEAMNSPVFDRITTRKDLFERRAGPPELLMWRDEPLWRYWMTRALYNNVANGIPEEEIPLLLWRMLPKNPPDKNGPKTVDRGP
jgi:predicted Ser/Thr protein kinase